MYTWRYIRTHTRTHTPMYMDVLLLLYKCTNTIPREHISIHPSNHLSIHPTVSTTNEPTQNGNDVDDDDNDNENALLENNKRDTFCSCIRVEKYNTSHFMYTVHGDWNRMCERKRERERETAQHILNVGFVFWGGLSFVDDT